MKSKARNVNTWYGEGFIGLISMRLKEKANLVNSVNPVKNAISHPMTFYIIEMLYKKFQYFAN